MRMTGGARVLAWPQVDIFSAVYEPPHGIGGAPTSAAGLPAGTHELASRGIVAKAVRVSAGCEATLYQVL